MHSESVARNLADTLTGSDSLRESSVAPTTDDLAKICVTCTVPQVTLLGATHRSFPRLLVKLTCNMTEATRQDAAHTSLIARTLPGSLQARRTHGTRHVALKTLTQNFTECLPLRLGQVVSHGTTRLRSSRPACVFPWCQRPGVRPCTHIVERVSVRVGEWTAGLVGAAGYRRRPIGTLYNNCVHK